MRISQVENLESSLNSPKCWKAFKKASWTASSASSRLCVTCWAIRKSLRSYRFTSSSTAATSPFLLAWTRSRSSLATVLTASCALSAVILVQGALENISSVEAIDAARNGKPSPLQCHLETRVSLHHDLAGHLRVDRAVVGIRSRLGKRVGELFIRIHHLRLEHAVCAHRRMRNVVFICPGNCRSDGHREHLRPKNEIIDFYLRVSRRGLVI